MIIKKGRFITLTQPMRSLGFLVICFFLASCYTTNYYSYSLQDQYNSAYRGCSKAQIINRIGAPSRTTSNGNGGEILIYENFRSTTIGTANASAYAYGNSANAYGNSYSYTFNGRNFAEFYIDNNDRCYQVRTNARGWEKRREKVGMSDGLRNGLLIGGGVAVATFLLLLLGGSK